MENLVRRLGPQWPDKVRVICTIEIKKKKRGGSAKQCLGAKTL